jgi:hypothetical protein
VHDEETDLLARLRSPPLLAMRVEQHLKFVEDHRAPRERGFTRETVEKALGRAVWEHLME